MIAALLSVWAVLVGVMLLMAGSGLQGSLLGVRASAEGFSVLVTGLIMSSYFGGFVIGSLVVPYLIRRVGHIRVFAALASLASITSLLHALFVEPATWSTLRVITGFCYIGLFIVAESWLNDRSTNQTRGQLLALYLALTTGAMAAGPLLLNLGRPTGFDLFIAASVMVSIATIPVALTTCAAPVFDEQERFTIRQLVKASPPGIAGCLGEHGPRKAPEERKCRPAFATRVQGHPRAVTPSASKPRLQAIRRWSRWAMAASSLRTPTGERPQPLGTGRTCRRESSGKRRA